MVKQKQKYTFNQFLNTIKINHNQADNIVVISYIIYLFLEIVNRQAYINMSSIPQGAFAACKLRDMNEKEAQVARLRYNDDQKHTNSNKQLEYGADKYHEKLMNSIWGLYNRYSPHNIKRNEYVQTEQGYYLQQHFNAVASNAVADHLATAMRTGM